MHELAYRDGKAQMFSVRLTPWHREGTIFPEAPSYDQVMTNSWFDYPLEKRPYWRPDQQGGLREAAEAFYVYRPDIDVILGRVGTDYEIVSNRAAFEILKPLVDDGVLHLETGGVLRQGADAWLLGRWELQRLGALAQEVLGEEILPYSTVLANHSGRRKILVGSTPIRIVCANTLGAAERDGRSRWEEIAHTKGAQVRLVELAERLFARTIERYESLAQQYRLLKDTLLTEDGFRRMVLDTVACDPRDDPAFNPEARLAEAVLDRVERKRSRITQLWKEGRGHDGTPSCWYAYNAVVEALDFDTDLWPTRRGCWRTASLLKGTLAATKQQVLDNLVLFAQAV